MEEIWKDIPGFEGLYKVSNFGRVKKLAKTRIYNNGTRTVIPEHFIKATANNRGYLNVPLYSNNERYTKKVHRLVAEVFLDNTDDKPYVNHINGNKADNRVENLEWCTPSENNIHRYNVLCKRKCGPSGKRVRCINTGTVFESISAASRATGIPTGNISKACTKKAYRGYIRHTAGGKRWEFC